MGLKRVDRATKILFQRRLCSFIVCIRSTYVAPYLSRNGLRRGRMATQLIPDCAALFWFAAMIAAVVAQHVLFRRPMPTGQSSLL